MHHILAVLCYVAALLLGGGEVFMTLTGLQMRIDREPPEAFMSMVLVGGAVGGLAVGFARIPSFRPDMATWVRTTLGMGACFAALMLLCVPAGGLTPVLVLLFLLLGGCILPFGGTVSARVARCLAAGCAAYGVGVLSCVFLFPYASLWQLATLSGGDAGAFSAFSGLVLASVLLGLSVPLFFFGNGASLPHMAGMLAGGFAAALCLALFCACLSGSSVLHSTPDAFRTFASTMPAFSALLCLAAALAGLGVLGWNVFVGRSAFRRVVGRTKIRPGSLFAVMSRTESPLGRPWPGRNAFGREVMLFGPAGSSGCVCVSREARWLVVEHRSSVRKLLILPEWQERLKAGQRRPVSVREEAVAAMVRELDASLKRYLATGVYEEPDFLSCAAGVYAFCGEVRRTGVSFRVSDAGGREVLTVRECDFGEGFCMAGPGGEELLRVRKHGKPGFFFLGFSGGGRTLRRAGTGVRRFPADVHHGNGRRRVGNARHGQGERLGLSCHAGWPSCGRAVSSAFRQGADRRRLHACRDGREVAAACDGLCGDGRERHILPHSGAERRLRPAPCGFHEKARRFFAA